MIVVSERNITMAWLEGMRRLQAVDGDAFTSILHVQCPADPIGLEVPARTLLDAALRRHEKHSTQTVANTLFPVALSAGRTVESLSAQYVTHVLPRIRQMAGNGHGTYFHRLISHTGVTRDGQVFEQNPLADAIAKMRTQLGTRGPKRAAYELAIYRPSVDSKLTMGFPCLSHVSVKLDTQLRVVHLSAVYRNQDYFVRAYGNLLGLARLQAFIARELGLGVGELVCHATHAQLGVAPGTARGLLAAMSATLAVAQVSRTTTALSVVATEDSERSARQN